MRQEVERSKAQNAENRLMEGQTADIQLLSEIAHLAYAGLEAPLDSGPEHRGGLWSS